MNYDILFTDMDGTLLNNEKSISKEVLQAMKQYTKQGGQIVLTSGRPLDSILKVVDALNLTAPNMYIISNNGALIYDLTNQKSLYEKRVPLSLVRTVLDTAYEMNLHCHTYSDTAIISEYDTPELHLYANHVKIPYQIEKNATDYLASIGLEPLKLLSIAIDDDTPQRQFADRLNTIAGDTIHTFFSQFGFLECCMKEISKGNAIQFLCNHLQIPIERCVAAGDNANDISMLKVAGLSYAMQNATQDAKDAADRITYKDNAHNGILEVFEAMY